MLLKKLSEMFGSGARAAVRYYIMAKNLDPSTIYQRYIEALQQLAAEPAPDWQAALQLCQYIKGRVVITGIGKSGHIGHKIAATFASTGTPAFFVHPTEANHGDLGMITSDDVIIALSNSGETVELAGIIAYAHAKQIPVIAICANGDSLLARAATHNLLIPKLPEVCPLGLAPTTSTILMLAVGDALAINLMQARGLTREAYRQMHPGGQLGKRLLRVQDVMLKGGQLPLVSADANLHAVIMAMTAGRLGATGVIDPQGKLIGIVTDGDLRRHLETATPQQTAQSIMTANPIVIKADALLEDALALMSMGTSKITVLFVVDDTGLPTGALHLHDLVQIGLKA